ncbi:hypothetical protein JCM10449v2_006136 [Rhodotorula kratochvilovae]
MATEGEPQLYRREPDLKSKQAVVILNLQGDLFDTALIAQGEEGGKIASAEVHRLVLEEMAKETPEAVDVAVYLVANDKSEGEHDEPTPYELFLDGFKASPRLSMVVNPIEAKLGGMNRVLQLLWFHLPTATRVFLGSIHRNYGAIYIEKLSAEVRSKITLVETVVVSPAMRKLVDHGGYSSTKSFKGLFTDMTYGVGLGIPPSKYLVPREEREEGDAEESTGKTTTGEDEERTPSSPMARTSSEAGPTLQQDGPKQSTYPPAVVPNGSFKVPELRFDKPWPCNFFYLAKCGCVNFDTCRFSHDYHFRPWEWKAYPLLVKSTLCANLRDAGMCRWGDDCIFGHHCPYTVEGCPYRERCRFAPAGLPHSVGGASEGMWRRREAKGGGEGP